MLLASRDLQKQLVDKYNIIRFEERFARKPQSHDVYVSPLRSSAFRTIV